MPAQYDFLIVEDELLIAEMISEILTGAGHTQVRHADSVEEATALIEQRRPDLVLTDIALGKDKTGIDLGTLLHSKYNIPFIYVTSHSSPEILGKAKHTRPNAYIVKPFKEEDLLVAIEFALFNTSQNSGAPVREEDELTVKEGRVMVKLSYSDILFFEADGNYTSIIMRNSKKRMVRTPISEFETQLNPQRFLRIHKSYIINTQGISEVSSSNVIIGNQELPIGRTYQNAVSMRFTTK